MACRGKYQEQLSEYMDGALDRNALIEMEVHLKTCTVCREELEALRTLSQELASLEILKTPGGFLDQVHEKIERRSFIKRVKKKLFQPFHLKIPLEAAALVATAVIVFSIWEIEKDEMKLVSTPIESRQGTLVEKQSSEKKKLLNDKNIPEPPPRASIQLREAPSPGPAAVENLVKEKTQSPIELLLVIHSPERQTNLTQGIEKKDTQLALSARSFSQEEMDREGDSPRKMQETEKSPIEETIPNLEKLIHSMDGAVTKQFHDDSAGLEAVIPSSKYEDFLKALSKMGALQDPPKTPPKKGGDSILLRITLKN